MKFSPKAFLHSRFPLAIAAGLLLALAFPKFGVAGFAWIAPGLMLAIALGKRGGESFRLGYVAGLAHYLASLYWLLHIPVSGFPILGWLALAAFLALFPATWVWLAMKVSGAGYQASANWLESARAVSATSWSRRMSWALFCAAMWVGWEMIVARIFGGFPWNLLADSQYRILPLIQFASFTGVYGVSFLITWTSISLLCAVFSIIGRPTQRSPWMMEIILPFTAVTVAFLFGFHQLTQPATAERELKVTLVQPSIPQTFIWNPDNDAARFQELLRLSEKALTNETDVLIWPEAATPGLPRYDETMSQGISNLARNHHVWMIIGADDAEATPTATNYFNASFLVSPEGKLVNSYRKRGLVMFGEYIPLERWLPFIKWFTPITGSYTPGDRGVQFVIDRLGERNREPHEIEISSTLTETHRIQTSVLICFEDIFPHLARKSVERDTDFLVNITNDGWFGEGAAQWQHAAAATFRTVENGVPLIRCANTGLTCWIDANGRWEKVFTDTAGTIYGAGSLTFNLPVGERHSPTFYNQHGDWFGWACVGLTLAFAAPALVRSKKTA